MEDQLALADAVNSRMRELGVTEQEIAGRSGIAVATLQQIQHGTADRRAESTLAALSRALDLPERHLSKIIRGQTPGRMDESGDPGKTPQAEALTDDQRQHLGFIQAAIRRLATTSFAAKCCGLTVATATFGFAATQAEPLVAALGIVVAGVLAVLDSCYLREKRLFGLLYEAARRGQVEVYSMSRTADANGITRRAVVWSWPVLGFYLPLVLIGLAALLWAGFGPGPVPD